MKKRIDKLTKKMREAEWREQEAINFAKTVQEKVQWRSWKYPHYHPSNRNREYENKAKAEKDKSGMERDLQEARQGLDEAMRDRANHERNGKLSQGEKHTKVQKIQILEWTWFLKLLAKMEP